MATPRKIPKRLVRFLYLLGTKMPLTTFNETLRMTEGEIEMDADLEAYFTKVAFELKDDQ